MVASCLMAIMMTIMRLGELGGIDPWMVKVVRLGGPRKSRWHDPNGRMDGVEGCEGVAGEAVAGDGSNTGDLSIGGEDLVQAEDMHSLKTLGPYPYLHHWTLYK